jgi:hypothetical protein
MDRPEISRFVLARRARGEELSFGLQSSTVPIDCPCIREESDMPRSVSVAKDWAMIVVAFGFLVFILLSPTGSFVSSPMEHTRHVVEARSDGSLMTVQASAVDREAWIVHRVGN